MSPRTGECGREIAKGRLSKAAQFFEAAELIRRYADDEAEVGDSFVTLCVHAGIAAADAICCAEIGRHAKGENHAEAVALIRLVRPDGPTLADALSTLLSMKTRAGYGAVPVSDDDRTRAGRRASTLLEAARARL